VDKELDFKSCVAPEDDVEEDDVQMTVEGGTSGSAAPEDEDPCEKQMRLSHESQVRVSTTQRYGNPQSLDQLEEWIKETPIPYICNDKFSSVRKTSVNIGLGVCQGTLMSTNRTLMSLGCGDSSMVALHLETG
jgi:hypothetical protein